MFSPPSSSNGRFQELSFEIADTLGGDWKEFCQRFLGISSNDISTETSGPKYRTAFANFLQDEFKKDNEGFLAKLEKGLDKCGNKECLRILREWLGKEEPQEEPDDRAPGEDQATCLEPGPEAAPPPLADSAALQGEEEEEVDLT
jgi:hypothetical protein